jgi:RNA polymerase sigma-70 factor (ECF subfamily)
MATDEADLVERAQAGDARARDALLAAIRPGVVRYCRARLGRVGGAYDQADDVAQEVCLAVVQALPRYRDRGRPFQAFVFGVAAHKVADVQRAALRGQVRASIDDIPDRPDPTPGPEQRALSADLARRLGRLLAHLSEDHRELIVLRVAVGLSAEEVGGVLGMSAAAVRVTQSRVLARLRGMAGNLVDEVAA